MGPFWHLEYFRHVPTLVYTLHCSIKLDPEWQSQQEKREDHGSVHCMLRVGESVRLAPSIWINFLLHQTSETDVYWHVELCDHLRSGSSYGWLLHVHPPNEQRFRQGEPLGGRVLFRSLLLRLNAQLVSALSGWIHDGWLPGPPLMVPLLPILPDSHFLLADHHFEHVDRNHGKYLR